jgi:hypothetical protein
MARTEADFGPSIVKELLRHDARTVLPVPAATKVAAAEISSAKV